MVSLSWLALIRPALLQSCNPLFQWWVAHKQLGYLVPHIPVDTEGGHLAGQLGGHVGLLQALQQHEFIEATLTDQSLSDEEITAYDERLLELMPALGVSDECMRTYKNLMRGLVSKL